jgi:putative sterol carrier protein
MPLFPSEEWVDAWVALANSSEEFQASGSGWEGSVAAMIEADPAAGVPETLYVRLDGRDGKWLGHAIATDASLEAETVFTLRAPYQVWKQVIRQELGPTKGLLQGKIRIKGHLPIILSWLKSLAVLAELAGRVETEFADELLQRSRPGLARDGA